MFGLGLLPQGAQRVSQTNRNSGWIVCHSDLDVAYFVTEVALGLHRLHSNGRVLILFIIFKKHKTQIIGILRTILRRNEIPFSAIFHR